MKAGCLGGGATGLPERCGEQVLFAKVANRRGCKAGCPVGKALRCSELSAPEHRSSRTNAKKADCPGGGAKRLSEHCGEQVACAKVEKNKGCKAGCLAGKALRFSWLGNREQRSSKTQAVRAGCLGWGAAGLPELCAEQVVCAKVVKSRGRKAGCPGGKALRCSKLSTPEQRPSRLQAAKAQCTGGGAGSPPERNEEQVARAKVEKNEGCKAGCLAGKALRFSEVGETRQRSSRTRAATACCPLGRVARLPEWHQEQVA